MSENGSFLYDLEAITTERIDAEIAKLEKLRALLYGSRVVSQSVASNGNGSISDRILSQLASGPKRTAEVAKAIKARLETVQTAMSNLRARKLVKPAGNRQWEATGKTA